MRIRTRSNKITIEINFPKTEIDIEMITNHAVTMNNCLWININTKKSWINKINL